MHRFIYKQLVQHYFYRGGLIVYKLRELLTSVFGMPSEDLTSDDIFCAEVDATNIMLVNQMKESFYGFSYTLIREGSISVSYNGIKHTAGQGDLFIYSPNSQNIIEECTPDFRGISLMCDAKAVVDIPAIRDIMQVSLQPAIVLNHPHIHLTKEQLHHFWQICRGFIYYQASGHTFTYKCMHELLALFMLDLTDITHKKMSHRQVSQHTAEQSITFLTLLHKHFIKHHDIGFYANEMCITTTHLSRIVRQTLGHTVIECINMMLLIEAIWLLRSTDLTIAAIADRLNFATPGGFTRFFTRMKGTPPNAYRMQQ